MKPLLTISQVADLLTCSTRHVRRLIADGRLPVVAIGTGRKGDRIDPADLEAYVLRSKRRMGVDACPYTNVAPFGGSRLRSVTSKLDDLLAKAPRGRMRSNSRPGSAARSEPPATDPSPGDQP